MTFIRTNKIKAGGHIDTTAPMRDVRLYSLNNLTPLSRSKGVVMTTCDNCFEVFTKRFDQRKGRNFCSPGCYHEACRVPVEGYCVVCGNVFVVCPSVAKKKSTCSKKCAYTRLRWMHTARPSTNVTDAKTAHQHKLKHYTFNAITGTKYEWAARWGISPKQARERLQYYIRHNISSSDQFDPRGHGKS